MGFARPPSRKVVTRNWDLLVPSRTLCCYATRPYEFCTLAPRIASRRSSVSHGGSSQFFGVTAAFLLFHISTHKGCDRSRTADSTIPAIPQFSRHEGCHRAFSAVPSSRHKFLLFHSPANKGCDSSCPPDKVNAGQRPADSTIPAVPQPSTQRL
ncbi:hypothetical protein Bbelb_166030 [Branchiostoma belcheri]|nr:hypothetical protein Bbelb_166030 [Branchiostoma belcheri]